MLSSPPPHTHTHTINVSITHTHTLVYTWTGSDDDSTQRSFPLPSRGEIVLCGGGACCWPPANEYEKHIRLDLSFLFFSLLFFFFVMARFSVGKQNENDVYVRRHTGRDLKVRGGKRRQQDDLAFVPSTRAFIANLRRKSGKLKKNNELD